MSRRKQRQVGTPAESVPEREPDARTRRRARDQRRDLLLRTITRHVDW